MTAIDTTVELAAPTNLLNPPRFSPVVVTPEIVTLSVTFNLAVVVIPDVIKSPNTVAPIAVVDNLSVLSKYKSQ